MPTGFMHSGQQRIHQAVLISWLLLFLWVAGHVLLRGLHPAQWLKALIYTLPLLLCIHGLWQARRHTHKWATLCVLPYFVVGITEGVANTATRNWALTMLGLSLLWFFFLVAYLRLPAPAESSTDESSTVDSSTQEST